jgi:heptosyltransferase-3
MMPALAPTNALRGMREPARVLVITLRRLGDVLLTTPLIRTLRRGYPRARIDVLAFRGGERILAGNPDIGEVVTMPERPSARETAALIGRLWRRYDLVVSTQSGDRPTFYALIAGRYRVGLVPPAGETGARWKRHAYHVAIAPDPDSHRIAHFRQLTDALGLPFVPDLVCPQGGTAGPVPRAPYAVLHANPAYRYKRWTSEGWRALARALAERGLAVVATGGPDAAERAYLDDLWAEEPAVIRLDGRLDWPQLAGVLAGAAVYIGVDTSMSHLAAAAGCPTVALYGPTSPRLIGPWPVGGLAEPWAPSGTIQQRGNVQVVQNPLPCLPCEKLGCAGHLDS